jgi:hypothetical protein
MMLPSDIVLMEDPAFKKYVLAYAKDEKVNILLHQNSRRNRVIAVLSSCNQCFIVSRLLRYHYAIVVRTLRNSNAIDSRSIRNQFKIGLLSLRYEFAVAAQSSRDSCAMNLLLMRNRFTIAARLLRNRTETTL